MAAQKFALHFQRTTTQSAEEHLILNYVVTGATCMFFLRGYCLIDELVPCTAFFARPLKILN